MLNLFQKKPTIDKTINLFSNDERIMRVCLFKILTDKIIADGLSEKNSKIIAAQGVNYITGEDWEAIIQNIQDLKIKSVTENYKLEIISYVENLLEKDKKLREIVVYFLRIRTVLFFHRFGKDWFENPMKERIEKILVEYGSEFPEGSDPVRFNEMVLELKQKRVEQGKIDQEINDLKNYQITPPPPIDTQAITGVVKSPTYVEPKPLPKPHEYCWQDSIYGKQCKLLGWW